MVKIGLAMALMLAATASAATVTASATAELVNDEFWNYCEQASAESVACDLSYSGEDFRHFAVSNAFASYGYIEGFANVWGDMSPGTNPSGAMAFAEASFSDEIFINSAQTGFVEVWVYSSFQGLALGFVNGISIWGDFVLVPVDFSQPFALTVRGVANGHSDFGGSFAIGAGISRLLDSNGREIITFEADTSAPEVSSALAVGTAFVLIGLISAVRKRRAHR